MEISKFSKTQVMASLNQFRVRKWNTTHKHHGGEGWLVFPDLWSGKKKTLMELIFNSFGEFWWNPEGPVSLIHSLLTILLVPLGFFQIFKVCSDAKERVRFGKKRETITPSKMQPGLLNLQSKACFLAERQSWFLSLQWRTWLEHPNDNDYFIT